MKKGKPTAKQTAKTPAKRVGVTSWRSFQSRISSLVIFMRSCVESNAGTFERFVRKSAAFRINGPLCFDCATAWAGGAKEHAFEATHQSATFNRWGTHRSGFVNG